MKLKDNKSQINIVLYTLLFGVLLAIGYITVWISLNMAQTPLIRIIIGASGPVWAIISVWYIASQKKYMKNWHAMGRRKKHKHQKLDTQFYPEYLELKEKYPLAIRRHEQHCRHHQIDVDQMVEIAMAVSEAEWQEREAFRRASHDERHKNDGKPTYQATRLGNDGHI